MESRLRKLELAGFSSALIGNVCPKRGFRKVTSTVSASSSGGGQRAARFSPAYLRAGGSLELGGVTLNFPEQEIQCIKTNTQGESQPPSSLLISFPGPLSPHCPVHEPHACSAPAQMPAPAQPPFPAAPWPRRGAGTTPLSAPTTLGHVLANLPERPAGRSGRSLSRGI